MSDTQPEVSKPVDPFEQWRVMRDSYMDIWAKAMGEAVNSEAYSKASGAMLETFLMTAPFREAQKKMMLSALEQLNMPSRVEFLSLAERFSNLELLLDDIDNKLNKILQLATDNASRPTLSEPPQIVANVAAQPPQASQPEQASKALEQVPEVDRSLPVEESGDARSEAKMRSQRVASPEPVMRAKRLEKKGRKH